MIFLKQDYATDIENALLFNELWTSRNKPVYSLN